MSSIKVQLAMTGRELTERVQSVRETHDGKSIMVAVDFSDHSRAALLQAAALAQTMSASLLVLHVVHDPGEMPGYYAKLVKKKRAIRMQDIAADAFGEFIDGLGNAHPELEILGDAELLMVIGLPVTRILEVAERLDPLMLVMGSQGRTGLKHMVIGSKATQVMQLCRSPVLIVKKNDGDGKR